MSLRYFVFLLFASLLFASCEENNFDKYQGIWEGSFSGDREGTWKIGIDNEGISEGVIYPIDSEGQAFTFKGSVNEDGELSMNAMVFGGTVIYEAYLTETTLSGPWTSDGDNFTGVWSGAKREKEDRFPYGLL